MFKKICPFFIILSLTTIAFVASAPAQQRREYATGMHYKAMETQPPVDNSETEAEASPKMRIYNPNANKPEAGSQSDIAKAKEEIWDKYKALAAGTYEEDNKDDHKKTNQKPQTPTKPDTPATQATQEAQPQKATGFAKILQDYQKSKARQGQMRSIQIATPENAISKPQKPQVASPATETK